jgi:hypothetical protein
MQGSGKTHSIIGELRKSADSQGIIPRAVHQIFDTISLRIAEDSRIKFNVLVSFLEIYNDECRDLLHQDVSPRDINIREGKDGKIFTTGIRSEVVYTREEALLLLEYGAKFRMTGGTEMNNVSSRSHSIYTVSLEILLPSVRYF